MYAKKANHPSGKKGDLMHGLAAIQVCQLRIFDNIGRLPLKKPVIDEVGERDQEVQIFGRDMTSSPPVVPQQGPAISQEDTKTLVRPACFPSLSLFATTTFQQTAIVGLSSILQTTSDKALVRQQEALKSTFLNNIDPPFLRSSLPEPERFQSIQQLAFGRHLLKKTEESLQKSPKSDILVIVEDDNLSSGVEEVDRRWVTAIMHDEVEKDRLCWLTSQVVSQFLDLKQKDASSIAEVTLLGPILDPQDYRSVLSSLIQQFEETLLDPQLLTGLVYFLQSAEPGHLIDNDLVGILRVLRQRLEDTHIQVSNNKKSASEHIHLLVLTVSRVLDTMVEGNVQGLKRSEDHKPLLNLLAGLRDSPDLYLKYQAKYAWQALQYIGDDESPLNMALRLGGGLVIAGLGVAGALRLDIGCLFNGLRELGDAASQVRDTTKSLVESV
ncbi:hypothetical protein BGZ68_001162 [Mortierella alpina]|nr:hypothetical protein BGZ68_001162 [Mortierella alpina]